MILRIGKAKLIQNLSLSRELESTLVGIMLGDGHLQTQNGGETFRLIVGQGGTGTQGEAHREYVYHLHDMFSDFCYKKPRKLIREDSLGNNPRWVFHTIGTKLFNPLAEEFYRPLSTFPPHLRLLLTKPKDKIGKGDRLIKVCPENIVDKLDECALSYWYMDDGSQKDPKSGASILNTQSFTLSQCQCLCEALKTRFNLDSQIRYKAKLDKVFGHQIYIKSNQNRLLKLVEPYYLDSMRYKLPKVVRVIKKVTDKS